jgi:LCP family protein required for cell wall assembly
MSSDPVSGLSVTSAPPTRPRAPSHLPPGWEPPEPRRRPSAKRILLGALLVFLVSAGVGAAFVLGQIIHLRNALSQNPSLAVGNNLAPAGFGDPQTLLLVGDDQRSLTKYYHHAVPHLANEMLLVRLDPNKPYISMMSIPRELQVTIYPPGQAPYTDRINSAYTHGIGVLVSTIKGVLGLPVNHVVVITFGHFKHAVDQMGCVYSTVDQRYYHSNVGSVDQYQEINLQPGYQKLCGDQALQFVSYRHTDTSLVRDARDQSFLLDVKKQYGPTLVDNVGKFEQIFGQAVQTDQGLHTTSGVQNLLGTLISSSGLRVRQVQFQANLLPTYDTATPQQITDSVHSFLYGGSALPTKSTAAVAHAVHNRKAAARLPLVPTPSSELAQARTLAANVPFPLEYPRVRDSGGSADSVFLRTYLIHAPDGTAYPAYVSVVSAGALGQFYDVQGTTWTAAPQFSSPDQTVTVGGRTYSLYYEGDHLRMVAWYEHGAVYWIRNSLTDQIQNGELLAIAEQTEPVAGVAVASPARLKAVGVPLRATAKQSTSALQTVGSLGGLLTLLAVPLLAIPLLKRRRELAEVRGHMYTSLDREARLQTAANAAGLPVVPLPAARAAARASRAASPPPARNGRTAADLAARRAAQRRWRRRKAVLAGVLVAVAAVGGVVVLATQNSAKPLASHRAGSRSASGAAGVPSIPVAVLNATSTQGAAANLAQRLRAKGVNVATVGNVTASRPSGLQILYAQGEQTQAQRLAGMLTGQSPTVAPMDAATQAAAGRSSLAVVIG